MKIHLIESYGLVNASGDELMLHLGRLDNLIGLPEKDAGFRWSMNGKNIPMLYRSGEWFNGFPKDTTLKWFADNGWAVRCKSNHVTGTISTYDLPSVPEDDVDRLLINEAIRAYYTEDWKLCECAKLYRMLTGETCVTTSMNEVEYILFGMYADPKATATQTKWISVSTDRYPEDGESVHILYQYYNSDEYFCDITACRNGGVWCDANDGIKLNVKVAAWKPYAEPYKGDDAPATEINLT